VVIGFDKLSGTYKGGRKLVITARDISVRIASDQEIVRGHLDREEKVRERVARDLHESLGQQIGGVKFELCKKAEGDIDPVTIKDFLLWSNHQLDAVLTEMRGICFEMLPGTLEAGSALEALRELTQRVPYAGRLHFRITVDNDYAGLGKSWEVDLFRIMQEFIHNSIDHGKATRLVFHFEGNPTGGVLIRMRDNGKGFIKENVKRGMGIRNIESRVKANGGTCRWRSSPGKGTSLVLQFDKNEKV
jgi:signal transduction histidine kinase